MLSYTFTWRGRSVWTWRLLRRRWLAFYGSIAGMAMVNMLVFVAARSVLPTLLAPATGLVVAAIGNFVLGDHLVFRSHERMARRRVERGAHDSAA